MKKVQHKTSIIDYLAFLFLGLIIAGFLYGGLTINKLTKANLALEEKQTKLETKLESQIVDLENRIIDNDNELIVLNDKLDQNDKKLAYYRQLAVEAQNKLAQAQTDILVAQSTNNISAAIKTVTKKVYVETKKSESTLTIEGLGSYKVPVTSGDTAFTILKKASDQYDLKIKYDTFSFGVFITEIGGLKPVGNQYWAFYYNGKYSQVGSSDQKILAGDTIYWRLENF